MSTTAPTTGRALGWHRPLVVLAAAMAALALACAVGLVLDDRTVTGLPVWDKPLKFALSTMIYAVTWAWLVALVRHHLPARAARRADLAATVAAVLLAVELVIIVGQAARGRTSHFNHATALDATLYRTMAVSIVVVWMATLYLTVLLFRARELDPARARALRAGAAIAVAGMALGFLMTSPAAGQIAAGADVVGAHTVGLADGGPGLPFLGWSTAGGDLRLPHFVGMHALQALPLVLIALELLAPRVPVLRSAAVRGRLVGTAAAAFTALLALLTWQALRGQSVVAPDGATLGAAGVIVVVTAVAVASVLRTPAPEPAVAG